MYNHSTLVGRITRAPELRYTPQGTAVTTFNLAVDRPFQAQGKEKETDFFPIVTWRSLAEIVATKLDKGRLVLCSGRFQRRSYEKDGVTHWVTELIADDVRFLDWPAETSKDSNGGNSSRPPQNGNTAQEPPPNWYNNDLPY